MIQGEEGPRGQDWLPCPPSPFVCGGGGGGCTKNLRKEGNNDAIAPDFST